jgi:putative FmdB family regulatory protein
MPVFDYQCRKCNHIFEREHAIGAEPRVRCPICNGLSKKLISRVGIVFKGSGFYCTDNRGKSGGNGSSLKEEQVKSKKGEKKETSRKSSDDDD